MIDDSMFELQVFLLGPERTRDTTWGPRTDRDTLARLDVPVTGERGWMIYQEAVRRAISPAMRIEFPVGMSTEEAERFRTEWQENRGKA